MNSIVPIVSGKSWGIHETKFVRLNAGDVSKVQAVSYPSGLGFGRLLRMLECFLHVADRAWDPKSQTHDQVVREFIGAIYSARFFEAAYRNRYSVTNAFRRCASMANLPWIPDSIGDDWDFRMDGDSDFVRQCRLQFEAIRLDPIATERFRGWQIWNADGVSTHLPLQPIFEVKGSKFTSELHCAIGDWYRSGRATSVPVLKDFCIYVTTDAGRPHLDCRKLKDGDSVLNLLTNFGVHFAESRADRGLNVGLLTRDWNDFGRLFETHLCRPSLFAAPTGGFPYMCRQSRGTPHLRKTDGTDYVEKLLTPVPLELTDDAALEALIERIDFEVDVMRKWATFEIEDLNRRVRRRVRLAKAGSVRLVGRTGTNTGVCWQVAASNPAGFSNQCATFEYHGYVTREEEFLSLLFPQPLSQSAFDLGIPTAGALLPHAAALIVEHPHLTPGFLERTEIYDKNGQIVGMFRKRHGWSLKGPKLRRGRRLAEQVAHLNRTSLKALCGILRATRPLRDYLRAKGDDRWRFLLLSSGRAFSYPRTFSLAASTSPERAAEKLAISLAKTWDADYETRLNYSKRFSLPGLRASTGVLEFVRTRDARHMAEKLGHKEYEPSLLRRYLPESILQYFQDRWIRLFQEGLILQAMENSPLLLKASSFSSMSEVSDFLRTHALRLPPLGATKFEKAEDAAHAAVGVCPDVLALLLSLRDATAMSTGRISVSADFWASFADRIEADIESGDRDDLKHMLNAARSSVDPAHFRSIVNA